ncbi:MAG TPA: glycosyltransferase family 2 protein, partial [Xanthobacteraceae bacterium]
MNILMCMIVRNEQECLKIILPLIPKPGIAAGFDNSIAVDGGSTDRTVDLLKAAGIEVLQQTRRGRGAACIEAMEVFDADAYLFFSPDGNEDVADLSKFRTFLDGGADLVIASRMMRGAVNEEDGHLFKPRKIANKSFNLAANAAFRRHGPFITDSINGYRAIRRSLARRLKLDASDYTFEYQMTMRALRVGANIVEFPTHERPRIAGDTGAPSIPTGLRFARRL